MKWEEPGPSRSPAHSRNKNQEIAAALRAHPKRWAMIEEGPSNRKSVLNTKSWSIKIGRGSWKPAGAFEATLRLRNGRVKLYARYVGEPENDGGVG